MTSDQILTEDRAPTRAERRRLFRRAVIRSFGTVLVLLVLYFLLPLQGLRGVPVQLTLALGVTILTLVVTLQLRAVVASRYPGIRAVEALAASAPLFLLLYASAYFVLAEHDPANFSTQAPLTKTDALYFVITIFSTVGFGDITAVSQTARVLVTTQMLLDLVVLGLGVQVYRGAVNVGRRRAATASPSDLPPGTGQADRSTGGPP